MPSAARASAAGQEVLRAGVVCIYKTNDTGGGGLAIQLNIEYKRRYGLETTINQCRRDQQPKAGGRHTRRL